MAKNYTRHATSKRFERPNFGDMGLRAYQEQQKRIIDGMKLQAAQHKETRDDYQRGSIDKARKERENRQELKEFEDAVWDNKQLSKKIRADREVEALEQKALEAEKSSKFWLNFSTTYSQQYAKVATDIHDAIDLKSATKKITAAVDSGEYDSIIENTKILNNISQAGVAEEQQKNDQNPNLTGEQKRDENAKLRSLQQVRSHNKDRILSEKLIGDIDKILIHLKDAYKENNLKLDKDNIQSVVQERALEIMSEFGINPNSDGGQKFLRSMWKKAGEEQTGEIERHKATEDNYALWGGEDAYNEGVGIIPSLKATAGEDLGNEWEIHFSEGLSLFQNRYVTDPKTGQTTLIKLDPKQAYEAVTQLLVEEGIITSDNYERLANIPYPGQSIPAKVMAGVAKDKRKIWWDRHPDLKDTIEDSLKAKEKKQRTDDKELREARDHKALTQLKVDIEGGKYDLNNLDDIAKLQEANAKNENTLKFINEAAVFNPTNNETDGYLVTEKLNKHYQDNDYNAYVSAMQYLGEDDKKRFNKLTRQLDELNRSGGSNAEIRKEIEKFIKADLKLNALNDAEDPSVSSMADVMIQDFYFEYRKIANDESLSGEGKVDKALMAVKEKYKSGEGLYRKEGEGNSTSFPAMKGMYDPRKAIDPDKLDEKLVKGWDNLFTEIEKTEDLHLLEQDWVDRNLRNIVNGFNVESNATIDHLYYSQPQRAKMFSKTEILNKYLAAKGIKTQVPLGALDKVDRDVIENVQININNFNKLSDENKMRMRVYLETGVMPNEKPKDIQTLEKNDEIRKNYINRTQGQEIQLKQDRKRTQLEEIQLKQQLEKKE